MKETLNFLSELLDFKLNVAFAGLIALFNLDIETFYKIVCGFIFVGYNLNKWYIMVQNYIKNKKNDN